MCGIYGYVGAAASIDNDVLGALRAMEYRGYDSWGTAYVTPDHKPRVMKRVGRVPGQPTIPGNAIAAIGHTRWATHGAVDERNAHPHLSADGQLAVVHNGIVENADALRGELGRHVDFASDTDSEVMAHLVSERRSRPGGLRLAVQGAFELIEGANAFVVLDLRTQEMVAVTRRLPIRIGMASRGVSLASDPVVFSGRADVMMVLPDNVAVSLGVPGKRSGSLCELECSAERISVSALHPTERGGPGGSMRAEIAEQPAVLRRLVASQDALRPAIALAKSARRLVFTGCGSAFHAARFAADHLAYGQFGIDGIAIPAAEMEARAASLNEGDVIVALSQSGETADVIDAIEVGTARGARSMAMVNVAGSSVARMVEVEVPLLAGHERSVLATKSFAAMLGRLQQLVGGLGMEDPQYHDGALLDHGQPALLGVEDLTETLASQATCRWVSTLADALERRSSFLVVGAGAHMAIASEVALKVKEGAYLHTEAVRAGEFKHGVIAMIDDGFPCLLLAATSGALKRLQILASELRSRGATVFMLVSPRAGASLETVEQPEALLAESPFSQTAVGQLLALEVALGRGVDPDFPRNLAKSVTVR